MAEKNGALSAFGVEEFEDLSAGFEMGNPAFGSIGPSQSSLAGALASIASTAMNATPIGQAVGLANVVGNISAEQAAAASLGTTPNYGAAVLGETVHGALTSNMSPSSMARARAAADVNKDGIVSSKESQNYGMAKGVTAYDGGINMARPSASISKVSTPSMPSYSQTATSTIEAIKDNLGISDASATSSGQGGVSASSSGKGIASGDYGLGMGPHGGPVQDTPSAPSTSDESSGGATYICTVIFEKGDMSKSVYKYDKLYGTVASENLFDGYAVWGKPLANLMKRNKTVYRIAKPIALSWANQMAYEKSNAFCGRKNTTGKVIKYIGEPLCYAIGFIINRSRRWLKST
jgi:hypothetical protein